MIDDPLAALLGDALPDLVAGAPHEWRFPIEPGARESVRVRRAPYWLSFEVALSNPAARPFSPIEVLRRQSVCRGNVKFVRDRTRLRADVPLVVGYEPGRGWLARQIGEVVQGLRAALLYPCSDSQPGDDEGTSLELIVEQFRVAGLEATVKADEEIEVAIEPRSVRRVVRVTREASIFCARVALDSVDPAQAGDVSMKAVAQFQLCASSSLRFARAFVTGGSPSFSQVGFECAVVASAADGPLVTAMDALVTACDLFGCEVEALIESPSLAHRYLQRTGSERRPVAAPLVKTSPPPAVPALPRAAMEAVAM